MKYKTGRWYNWDGKEDCPFDQNTTDYYIACFDTSSGHFYERGNRNPKVGINTYHKSQYEGTWLHGFGHTQVIAFYIVSYNEPKEMTVAEIEKELGYSVKVVK